MEMRRAAARSGEWAQHFQMLLVFVCVEIYIEDLAASVPREIDLTSSLERVSVSTLYLRRAIKFMLDTTTEIPASLPPQLQLRK